MASTGVVAWMFRSRACVSLTSHVTDTEPAAAVPLSVVAPAAPTLAVIRSPVRLASIVRSPPAASASLIA